MTGGVMLHKTYTDGCHERLFVKHVAANSDLYIVNDLRDWDKAHAIILADDYINRCHEPNATCVVSETIIRKGVT